MQRGNLAKKDTNNNTVYRIDKLQKHPNTTSKETGPTTHTSQLMGKKQSPIISSETALQQGN